MVKCSVSQINHWFVLQSNSFLTQKASNKQKMFCQTHAPRLGSLMIMIQSMNKNSLFIFNMCVQLCHLVDAFIERPVYSYSTLQTQGHSWCFIIIIQKYKIMSALTSVVALTHGARP